ncbi:MAG: hypothetical protein ACD_83C00150G0001, partial [uncultured bacterium]
MKFLKYKIDGVWIIDLEPKCDQRGFFMRSWDKKSFKEQGLVTNWVQENHSLSVNKG